MKTREDILKNGITLDEETEQDDQKEFMAWYNRRRKTAESNTESEMV